MTRMFGEHIEYLRTRMLYLRELKDPVYAGVVRWLHDHRSIPAAVGMLSVSFRVPIVPARAGD